MDCHELIVAERGNKSANTSGQMSVTEQGLVNEA